MGQSSKTLQCKRNKYSLCKIIFLLLSVISSFGRQTILDQEKVKHLSMKASLQITFHSKLLNEFN